MSQSLAPPRAACLVAFLALLSAGCAVWHPASPPVSVEAVLVDLATDWPGQGTPVTVLGFREADGTASPATAALDEALLSALMRAGVAVHPDAGIATAEARPAKAGLWPPGWRTLPGPLVVSGQLRLDPPWAYLRLAVADTASGQVRHDAWRRLPATQVTRLDQDRQARLARGRGATVTLPIEVEVHLVVRRDEGGFPRRVDWEEGGSLQEGDRVQLRLRTDRDCQLLVLRYRDDGDREVLLAGSVFAGRWIYLPGENDWRTLTEGNRVTSLYLAAASRIEADQASLWEALATLQQENRVERFRGLDLVDAAVADFVARTASDSVAVARGAAGARAGKPVRFVYADGTVFDSPGLFLTGPVILHAWSAEVRYR